MEYKSENYVKNNIINENDNISNNFIESLEKIINKDDIINFISSEFDSIIHNNKLMKKKTIKRNK